MSDFDDLRQIREAKERAEAAARQKALEDERQRADDQMRWQAAYIAHAESFHDMVVSVLEDLRTGAYTSSRSSIINDLKVSGGAGSWAIGFSRLHEHSYPVTVHLRYESDGKTPCLVVKRAPVKIEDRWVHFETMTCGVTQEELLYTLRSLHPPQTIGASLNVESTYVGW
jgi:hypothetical protein